MDYESLFAEFALTHGLSSSDLQSLSWFITNKGLNYSNYTHIPVGVRTFVESPHYMNAPNTVYEAIMPDLVAMNSPQYSEAVLTGGIGSGKTTLALYSTAYQLYLLSCLKNPHAEFGLDKSSEIIMVFQSINAKLAKQVDYSRFRSMIADSPYFREHFYFDDHLESKMVFRNRIEVIPVSGLETAAIGQNVIGGVIDEVNFMAVVDKSRMAEGGGTYDQAIALYESIARRRKTRFINANRNLPGLLCMVSSKRVPGQFTDRKTEEAKTDSSIYIFDKRVWEVKPEGTYCGDKFSIFVGDEYRKPRLLKDGEILPPADQDLVDHIPIEYRNDFTNDLIKSLRDIAGRSTLAIHPYMIDREAVVANFGKVPHKLQQQILDFSVERPKLFSGATFDPRWPRWVHIDLGLTSDNAGVSMACVPRFVDVIRGDYSEKLPVIEFDFNLAIKAPRNGEIEFSEIRAMLYKLRDMGVPIRWVSLDSYQSADTMQLLRQRGFSVGHTSMDTSTTPYDVTKQALYDGRALCPEHDLLRKELLSLERDFKRGKIDHPAHGSKDVSDSFAGCVYGLTTRKDVWGLHGIPIAQAVSVRHTVEAASHRE